MHAVDITQNLVVMLGPDVGIAESLVSALLTAHALFL
jgi:uncharacterized MnhB-related membrane protein